MFSKGQLLFAVFFVITFIGIMIFSYSKDLKNHKLHYRGSLRILIVFLITIAALFLIKYFTQQT
ncbi:MAG: hypothetical protein CMC93_06600 [Flavobacteriaceae bacterium]|nr:hypothetical protein [Flavobacteriaceae bacterium]